MGLARRTRGSESQPRSAGRDIPLVNQEVEAGPTVITVGSRCYVVLGHKQKGGRVVTSGQFLKKELPGRVDTSGTKTTIRTAKLWKCDLP